eukprot:scaffold109812_cov74-Phaeocystis_antarctica.AAC.2
MAPTVLKRRAAPPAVQTKAASKGCWLVAEYRFLECRTPLSVTKGGPPPNSAAPERGTSRLRHPI